MRLPGRSAGAQLSLYSGFFLTGVVTVLLGPLLPELRERWQLEPAQAGVLFVAQFAGSSVGAVVSSLHLRRSLVAGYALLATSLAALSFSGWALAPLAMAGIGLGLGLAIPASNLLVAHVDASRRAATLSTLNLMWGVGAMTCPLLVAALVGPSGDRTLLLLLAAAAGAVGFLLARARSWPAVNGGTQSGPISAGPGGFQALLLLALMLFLYVGVESAIGGWLVTFADQIAGERATESLLIGSGFWASLMAGRALAPVLLRRFSETRLFVASLLVAGLGAVSIVLAEVRGMVAAGSLVTGLGLAAIFPLIVSLLAAQTAASGSRGTGWMFSFAGLGGAALPWLTAQASIGGSLRRGFAVPLVGLGLVAILLSRYRSRALRLGGARTAGIVESRGKIS